MPSVDVRETAPGMFATEGYKAALQQVPGLKYGLNTIDGHLTNEAVAKALNIPFKSIDEFLK